MRSLVVSLIAWLAGCGGPSYPQAEDPESTFSFSLRAEAQQETQDRRVAWRMPSGVTVTAQRIAMSDSLVRERSVADVAQALTRRYELGEVDGSLATTRCEAAGARATCTRGWMALPGDEGGERFVRQGVLVEIRDEIVLFEVIGPEAKREEIEAQDALLRQTLTLRG